MVIELRKRTKRVQETQQVYDDNYEMSSSSSDEESLLLKQSMPICLLAGEAEVGAIKVTLGRNHPQSHVLPNSIYNDLKRKGIAVLEVAREWKKERDLSQLLTFMLRASTCQLTVEPKDIDFSDISLLKDKLLSEIQFFGVNVFFKQRGDKAFEKNCKQFWLFVFKDFIMMNEEEGDEELQFIVEFLITMSAVGYRPIRKHLTQISMYLMQTLCLKHSLNKENFSFLFQQLTNGLFNKRIRDVCEHVRIVCLQVIPELINVDTVDNQHVVNLLKFPFWLARDKSPSVRLAALQTIHKLLTMSVARDNEEIRWLFEGQLQTIIDCCLYDYSQPALAYSRHFVIPQLIKFNFIDSAQPLIPLLFCSQLLPVISSFIVEFFLSEFKFQTENECTLQILVFFQQLISLTNGTLGVAVDNFLQGALLHYDSSDCRQLLKATIDSAEVSMFQLLLSSSNPDPLILDILLEICRKQFSAQPRMLQLIDESADNLIQLLQNQGLFRDDFMKPLLKFIQHLLNGNLELWIRLQKTSQLQTLVETIINDIFLDNNQEHDMEVYALVMDILSAINNSDSSLILFSDLTTNMLQQLSPADNALQIQALVQSQSAEMKQQLLENLPVDFCQRLAPNNRISWAIIFHVNLFQLQMRMDLTNLRPLFYVCQQIAETRGMLKLSDLQLFSDSMILLLSTNLSPTVEEQLNFLLEPVCLQIIKTLSDNDESDQRRSLLLILIRSLWLAMRFSVKIIYSFWFVDSFKAICRQLSNIEVSDLVMATVDELMAILSSSSLIVEAVVSTLMEQTENVSDDQKLIKWLKRVFDSKKNKIVSSALLVSCLKQQENISDSLLSIVNCKGFTAIEAQEILPRVHAEDSKHLNQLKALASVKRKQESQQTQLNEFQNSPIIKRPKTIY